MPRFSSQPLETARHISGPVPKGSGFPTWRARDAKRPPAPGGLRCPDCGCDQTLVIDSRTTPQYGGSVRRRRVCPQCDRRFSSLEVVIEGGKLQGDPLRLSEEQHEVIDRAVHLLQALKEGRVP